MLSSAAGPPRRRSRRERSESIETRAEPESLSCRLNRQGGFFGSAPMFVDVHELGSGLSPRTGDV